MSHHISAPRATADPADIADLLAFPSPEQPSRLVLVFCWLPHGPSGRLPGESVLASASRAPCAHEGGERR